MRELSPWPNQPSPQIANTQPEYIFAPEPEEPALRDYWKMLRKRFRLVLFVFLAVFGLGEGIDALINEPVDSLADDEQYQTVMGLLPDAYYQVGYADLGQVIDPIMNLKGGLQALQALQSGSADALMNPSEGGSPRNIRAIGTVAFQEDNVSGSSTILYIDEG